MPTIDELQPVVVASDDDVLPVSQGGTARRVSRSQLLAGTQSTLVLTPGLLGRASPGLGSPEQISIGSGLSIANGVLSGPPPYSIGLLPSSSVVGVADLIPIGQGGQDHSVSVRALLSTGGIDLSRQTAQAAAGNVRLISEWVSDAIPVEAFGAVGDGDTDDSNSIRSALAVGRPILFGPKTYRVDGQLDIDAQTSLIGTEGFTTLRRSLQSGGAWIKISGPSFVSFGITYDAGGIGGDSWGVLLSSNCGRSIIQNCSFLNATGLTLGTGLTIEARDLDSGQASGHSIINCLFQGNACHGLWIQAAAGAEVRGCRAVRNGGFGICLDFNDPEFQQKIRQSSIAHCECHGNERGISVGNYNATNSEPPQWGLDNPDAIDIIVEGNVCSANTDYGIAVSGSRIQVVQNHVVLDKDTANASGILCNAQTSTIAYNYIVGPGQFGIDSGGSAELAVSSNIIESFAVGINAGGSSRIRLDKNRLVYNQRALTLFQVETDGKGANFGISCSDVWIEENVIEVDVGGGGIFLFDGPERVEVSRNRFFSTSASALSDLCWAHTDSVKLCHNTWNGSSFATIGALANGSVSELIVPDILDTIEVDGSTKQIDAILGLHQVSVIGQITFIRVTCGGAGYSQAKVVIGGLGSGAAATAYIKSGVIIGIAVSSGGSGYDTSTTSASILGDGQGATLQPFVGLPVIQDRRLTLRCFSTTYFSLGQPGRLQSNWTQAGITVPASSEIVWHGTADGWQAASFQNIDYLLPAGDGSVSIRSKSGDIRFQPGQGGMVRFGSGIDQASYVTSCGHGSPDGFVVAPPGSDYRNLDGGVGSTLWVKRVGTGNIGWFAIA